MSRNIFTLIFFLFLPISVFNQEKVTYPNSLSKDFSVDAPWRVKSATETIPIVVRIIDSDKNAMYLKKIEIWKVTSLLPNETLSTNPIYSYYPSSPEYINQHEWKMLFNTINGSQLGVSVNKDVYLKVIITYNEFIFSPENSFTQYLKITIGQGGFPSLLNWYTGDTHYHSFYTYNSLEFGLNIEYTSKLATAMGLDWLTITDHSCDISSDGKEFNSLLTDIKNNSNGTKLIRGEEVTADNNTIWDVGIIGDKRIHFLIYNNNFIKGPEVTNISGLRTLDDIINDLSGNGFGYAAHPYLQDDYIAKWDDFNITKAMNSVFFKGFQIWNQLRYSSTKEMGSLNGSHEIINPFPFDENNLLIEISQLNDRFSDWRNRLSRNLNPLRKIFISGGSDAHGDFNYQLERSDLLSTKIFAFDNAVAKVRTAIYCSQGMDVNGNNAIEALKNGKAVVTNGPILSFEIYNSSNNSTIAGIGEDVVISKSDIDNGVIKIKINWNNTNEFGGNINDIRLYYGTEKYSSLQASLNITNPGLNGSRTIELRNLGVIFSLGQYSFMVMEAYTDQGRFRCYTNPIWIKVVNTSQATEKRVLDYGDNLIHAIKYYDGFLWACTRTSPVRILKIDPATLEYQKLILPSGYNNGEDLVIAEGYIYVILSTDPSKIIQVEPNSMTWKTLIQFGSNEIRNGQSLTYSSGILWAGGFDRAIAKIDIKDCTYKVYKYLNLESNSSVHALASDKNYLWGIVRHYDFWGDSYSSTVLKIDILDATKYITKFIDEPLADDITTLNGNLYCGSENTPSRIYKYNSNLEASYFQTNSQGSFGIFYSFNFLWSVHIGSPGEILKFDLDLSKKGSISLPIGYLDANELVFDPEGIGYATSWEKPAKISKIIKVTSINERSGELPSKFTLAQNYPNPFNASTKINYSIPIPCYVKLIIYDLLGREVTKLVDEEQTVGTYEVKYDFSNLSSGIYLYQLRAGNYSNTKKLILLK